VYSNQVRDDSTTVEGGQDGMGPLSSSLGTIVMYCMSLLIILLSIVGPVHGDLVVKLVCWSR